jgi:hypothetical protein
MHLNDIHALPDIATIRARFERFVMPEPNSGCHLWLGGVDKDGYGKFRINGCDFKAHRVARALAGKDVPDTPLLHTCDVPCCANEAHGRPGTQLDNIADKVAKGRQAKGERQGNAKLTEADVIDIYMSDEPQIPIAAKYGIRQAQVSSIRRGATWKHVTQPLMKVRKAVDCRTRKRSD